MRMDTMKKMMSMAEYDIAPKYREVLPDGITKGDAAVMDRCHTTLTGFGDMAERMVSPDRKNVETVPSADVFQESKIFALRVSSYGQIHTKVPIEQLKAAVNAFNGENVNVCIEGQDGEALLLVSGTIDGHKACMMIAPQVAGD